MYVKKNKTRYPSLWNYNVDKKKFSRLTEKMTNKKHPSFSPDGKYFYFSSERDFNLAFSSYEFDYMFNRATRIYAAAVNDSIQPLIALQSDETAIVSDKQKDDNKNTKHPLPSSNFMQPVTA